MTAKEIVRRHLWIATELKTMYMYAAYGFLITDATITSKAKRNLNQWYTKNNGANEKKLRAVAGQGYVGFDCVNLTKGVLWGFRDDHAYPFGCGAVHKAHGVPDTNANGMITYCYDVSTDFSRIMPGEGLWMEGHWGLYVGDGKAVECTNWRYKDGVQITAVGNMGKISGLPSHTWTKHGKLPWVDYTEGGAVFIPLSNGAKGEAVRKMQEMLLSLHYSLGRWGADGDFGAATENAVMEFQDRNGLTVTGICDGKTMEMLEKLSTAIVDNSGTAGATSGAPTVDGGTAPADPGRRCTMVIPDLTEAEGRRVKAEYPKAYSTDGRIR